MFSAQSVSPAFKPWGTAGFVAAAVGAVACLVGMCLALGRGAQLEFGPLRPRVVRAAPVAVLFGVAAIVAGVASSSLEWVDTFSCVALGVLVALSPPSPALSARRLTGALAVAIGGGLVIGLLGYFVIEPAQALWTWLGLWLLGGLGVGTLAVVGSIFFAPLGRPGSVVDVTSPRMPEGRRRSRLVVLGAVLAGATALGGLIAFAGSTSLRGFLLFATNICVGLMTVLNYALLLAAAGSIFALVAGAFIGAAVGVLKGLSGPDVERRTLPNQGIHRSAANIAVFALLATAIVGIPYGVFNVLMGGIVTRVAPGAWDWINLGLGGALLFGVVGGFVPGSACLQHGALRLVLWCWGLAPWRYVRFLNHATERQLLERIGGRYRFIHDQLRDHLLEMERSRS